MTHTQAFKMNRDRNQLGQLGLTANIWETLERLGWRTEQERTRSVRLSIERVCMLVAQSVTRISHTGSNGFESLFGVIRAIAKNTQLGVSPFTGRGHRLCAPILWRVASTGHNGCSDHHLDHLAYSYNSD